MLNTSDVCGLGHLTDGFDLAGFCTQSLVRGNVSYEWYLEPSKLYLIAV